MPLKKWSSNKIISSNIKELVMDNKKKWKERWANWKTRSKKQIIAIALNKAWKSNKKAV